MLAWENEDSGVLQAIKLFCPVTDALWVEYRCFQASRLNLQAYDNAVQYRNAAGDHVVCALLLSYSLLR